MCLKMIQKAALEQNYQERHAMIKGEDLWANHTVNLISLYGAFDFLNGPKKLGCSLNSDHY